MSEKGGFFFNIHPLFKLYKIWRPDRDRKYSLKELLGKIEDKKNWIRGFLSSNARLIH